MTNTTGVPRFKPVSEMLFRSKAFFRKNREGTREARFGDTRSLGVYDREIGDRPPNTGCGDCSEL